MEVHQLLSSFVPSDAIGFAALYLQQLLRSEGYQSEIFAERVAPELVNRCHHVGDYPLVDSPEKILLAHYSVSSGGMVALPYFRARKILLYHNVTPYEYWLNINTLAAFHCLKGRNELPGILQFVHYGIGFSDFSIVDLHKGGLTKTARLPLMMDLSRLELPPDPFITRFFQGKEKRILIVGRVVPNKRVEEAIRIAAFLSNVRLIVVGSTSDAESYKDSLRQLARHKGVKSDFVGKVSQRELNALYRMADLLLVVSDHEGFCVPLLEAFSFKVPVVAFAAGAVPETANGGALLFEKCDPQMVAGLINRLLHDSELRAKLQQRGTEVLQQYAAVSVKEKLLPIIQEVASMPPLYKERSNRSAL
jgi:glycosyltransferase involved in cell wall biosynthesis